MAKILHYSTVVRWSDEDEAFVALLLELDGISGVGDTPQEAVEAAHTAAGLAVDVLKADGLPVPDPEPLPSYSGQFRVRLPRSLHRRLAERAAAEGVSLNTLIVQRLSEPVVSGHATTAPAGSTGGGNLVRLKAVA
jgi:predicted HicB family RNase H-like nuclease